MRAQQNALSRSGGMADATVSKTVEGKPRAGSSPAFGTTNLILKSRESLMLGDAPGRV